jgi:hypothetical protein
VRCHGVSRCLYWPRPGEAARCGGPRAPIPAESIFYGFRASLLGWVQRCWVRGARHPFSSLRPACGAGSGTKRVSLVAYPSGADRGFDLCKAGCLPASQARRAVGGWCNTMRSRAVAYPPGVGRGWCKGVDSTLKPAHDLHASHTWCAHTTRNQSGKSEASV